MQRIAQAHEEDISPQTTEMLDGVRAKMGMVPNIIQTMANSPATLASYLGFSGAVNEGILSAQLREQIALTAAGTNQCDYCASVHTIVGDQLGLDKDELAHNLVGKSRDPKTQAALLLTKEIIEKRGHVSDMCLEHTQANGFSHEEILEIFSVTMLNMFTNYFNHMVETEIDFPVVNTRGSEAA